MDKLYTEESTKHITPREFCRLRAGVYCGSTDYSTQLVKEAFANSLDEHNIGHGNLIKVKVNTELNEYIIEDEAQGFIAGAERPGGETMLSECFSVINTSGKYDDSDGSIYGGSALGLNGIGLKLICFLSSTSCISSTNGNGKRETLWYKDGFFDRREYSEEEKGKTGTIITYIPDPSFFLHKEANFSELRSLFKEISALCPSLYISFSIDGKEEIYHSEHGLNDLVDDKVKDKEIITNRFNVTRKKGSDLFDICLTYTSNYSEDITGYVNYGLTEGGVHFTALRTGITRLLNKFANDNGLFKKGESNLNGNELSEGLVIIFNLKAKSVSYDSQSKTRVINIDKTLINDALNEDFVSWLDANSKDVKIIIEKALMARRANEAARKAKEAARDLGKKKKEKALKFDSKLADCYSSDRLKCEIYITEGDSASANLKMARNNEFQAVMPVRGKIINTQKANLAQIQKNAEIMTMIDAFGLKIDPYTMKVTYNKSDLRYGKIIIMSDADVDGAHIKNLFYTFIWNFCPQLIKEGYIYAGVPPLYKVTIGKDYKYLKNDEELNKFKLENSDKKYLVNRMKGLGEMSVEETEETLTDTKKRIIKQITIEDEINTNILFEQLMGDGVTARKEYIKIHSKEATYNAE